MGKLAEWLVLLSIDMHQNISAGMKDENILLQSRFSTLSNKFNAKSPAFLRII